MIIKEFFAQLGLQVDGKSFFEGILALKSMEAAADLFIRGIKGALTFLPEVTNEVTEQADHLDELSQSTGVSTDALQELGYAASFSSISTDRMGQSLGFLARAMDNAGGETSKAFKGIATKDAEGKLRPVGDVLEDIAEEISKMPDGAAKTARSMQLFGRSGKDLIPFLNEGRAGIAKLREEARTLGVVLDEDTIKAFAKFDDTQGRLKYTWGSIKRLIAVEMLPVFSQLADETLEWWKANQPLIRGTINKALKITVDAFKAVIGALQGTVTILKELWRIATDPKVAPALQLIIKALLAIGAAAAIAAAPWLLWAAAIGAVILVLNSLQRWSEGKDSLIGDLIENQDKVWAKVISSIKKVFKEFVDWMIAKIDMVGQAVEDKIVDALPDFLSGGAKRRKAERKANLGIQYGPRGSTDQSTVGVPVDPFQDPDLAGAGIQYLRTSRYTPNVTQVAPQMSISMTIQSLPGMDEVKVAKLAAEEMYNNVLPRFLREAIAGVTGG